jgi:hypothetical protein
MSRGQVVPITVQSAEIRTAAVEVRTLLISGKQVTLAVFRQLREEPLIADDGALNGVPWGIVNYHPDKCADGPDHTHVVWQRGSELLRSAVECDPSFPAFNSVALDRLMARYTLRRVLGQTGGEADEYVERLNWRGRSDDLITCVFCEWDCGKEVNQTIRNGYSVDPETEYGRAQRVKVEAALSLLNDPSLLDAAKIDVQQEMGRRQRWRETTKALSGLPQLFIAV